MPGIRMDVARERGGVSAAGHSPYTRPGNRYRDYPAVVRPAGVSSCLWVGMGAFILSRFGPIARPVAEPRHVPDRFLAPLRLSGGRW